MRIIIQQVKLYHSNAFKHKLKFNNVKTQCFSRRNYTRKASSSFYHRLSLLQSVTLWMAVHNRSSFHVYLYWERLSTAIHCGTLCTPIRTSRYMGPYYRLDTGTPLPPISVLLKSVTILCRANFYPVVLSWVETYFKRVKSKRIMYRESHYDWPNGCISHCNGEWPIIIKHSVWRGSSARLSPPIPLFIKQEMQFCWWVFYFHIMAYQLWKK